MPLTAPSLKIELYLNDSRDSLFLQDKTDLYSSGSNPLGYNAPTSISVNSVTSVTVTLTYTLLAASLVYQFTVLNGVITNCTISFAGSTAVSIIGEITSTAWPFTSANRFELTKDYGVVLPALDDMVYTCSYRVIGNESGEDYNYSASVQELLDVQTTCCTSKLLAKADVNDVKAGNKVLTVNGWLVAAHLANEELNITKANSYITKAKALCEETGCGCGC